MDVCIGSLRRYCNSGPLQAVGLLIWVIVNIAILIEDDDVEVEDGASDVDNRIHEMANSKNISSQCDFCRSYLGSSFLQTFSGDLIEGLSQAHLL